MIEHIDAHYVAAQIRLVRQTHKGAILLLEGDTDNRVFEKFIDPNTCEIEIGFGKKNVLGALDLLEEDGFSGLVAVVDADFDRIQGVTYQLENLCVTDAHDLDLTIFASTAFDKYLNEYSDRNSYETTFGSNAGRVRERLILASLPIAQCRLASEAGGLRLYFQDFQLDRYVNHDTLAIDFERLASDLIARSKTTCTEAQLKRLVTIESTKLHDHYQLARGHDVAALLGIALRKLLATRRTLQTWATEIESGLRLAFGWDDLLGTNLYRCLVNWESSNPKYKIFRSNMSIAPN